MTMTSAIASLGTALAAHGLDLVQPLSVQAYNALAPAYAAPTMERPSTLALLIGNTRALWSPFTAAYRDQPHLQRLANPLDDYCATTIATQLERLFGAADGGVRYEAFWAPEPPPRRLLLQRAAVAAGLAYLAPSQLCIHPIYGPWFSLRALVVLDAPAPGDGGTGAAPVRCPAPCDCALACQPIIDRLALANHTQARVHAAWEDYLALRDACPVGRAHRFGAAQIRYHYTHQRDALTS
ncbi:MAG: hypothetical protein IPL79_17875 [Myxococcales bacterium]|nr:hypothetical protein [Myxococcales bacterium]